tara:strand:+ start:662 stop:853 length:192 start_codon:yes stop_codon:yes gene_type:complete
MMCEFEIGDLVQFKNNKAQVGLIIEIRDSADSTFQHPYAIILWANTGKKSIEFTSELTYAEKR